jgi:DNA invertase Pin-like site-specific DNA recombinase
MKVGYARTSTIEQIAGIEAQVRDLLAAGCEMKDIFQEHCSAVKQRDGLDKALAFVREGDTLIVTKLDRLARSVPDLYKIVDILKDKKVNLNILGLGIDTTTAAGQVMLTMMGAFAEFEREIMLERQKEGIEKAKEEGKYRGRKPMPTEIVHTVETYLETGVSKVWIAKKLGIGEATVYRIAKKWRKKPLSI